MIYYPLNCVFFNIAVFLVIALQLHIEKEGPLAAWVSCADGFQAVSSVRLSACSFALYVHGGRESVLFGSRLPLGGIVGLLAVFLYVYTPLLAG